MRIFGTPGGRSKEKDSGGRKEIRMNGIARAKGQDGGTLDNKTSSCLRDQNRWKTCLR